MSRLDGLRRVFRLGLWRKELDEELEFHRLETIEELIAKGASPPEAEAEARRRFGNATLYRRELEAIDGALAGVRRWQQGWDVLSTSLRYAARRLLKAPVFTAGVVLLFALGIGVNATMFSILDRILLSPPPHVERPEEVRRVLLDRVSPFSGGRRALSSSAPYPDLVELGSAQSFDAVAALSTFEITLGRGAEAEPKRAELVTGSYFGLLGVRPALGRFFTPGEDAFGQAGVAVISHAMWQARFGGDADVLGQSLDFGYGPYTIIGVAPAGFTGVDLAPIDAWLPIHVAAPHLRNGDTYCFESRNCTWIRIVARLAPGISVEAAAQEATATLQLARADADAGSATSEIDAVLAPIIAAQGPNGSEEARIATLLSGIALIVLLIACANITNLFIARQSAERRQVAVRLALGSSRARLVGQSLVETLMLAMAGGAAALVVTTWGGAALRAFLLPETAFESSGIALRTSGFVLLAAVFSGLLAGSIPAWQSGRSEVGETLKSGGNSVTAKSGSARGVLLAFQVALSVILLVAAGLFVRSLDRVAAIDLGFQPQGVLLGTLTFDSNTPQPVQQQLYLEAAARLREAPFVEEISPDASIPFRETMMWEVTAPDGEELPPDRMPVVHFVDDSFFRLMELEIRRGRGFSGADPDEVVVISESLAATLWPGEDPIGRCLATNSPSEDPNCREVIGIAEDAHHSSLMGRRAVHAYYPLGVDDRSDSPSGLLVRPNGDPEAILPLIRESLLDLDPRIRYADVIHLTDLMRSELRPWELGATLFALFGSLALLVAAIGLYSVLAYLVTQRTFELGIRRALGARHVRLLTAVLGGGIAFAATGALLGFGAAYLVAPQLEALLYEVSPRDPLTLMLAAGLLFLVAAVAAAVPAVRAMRVDPAVALRAE